MKHYFLQDEHPKHLTEFHNYQQTAEQSQATLILLHFEVYYRLSIILDSMIYELQIFLLKSLIVPLIIKYKAGKSWLFCLPRFMFY